MVSWTRWLMMRAYRRPAWDDVVRLLLYHLLLSRYHQAITNVLQEFPVRTSLACSMAAFLFLPPLHAQQPVMEPGPKSPEESLKCLKARPGFTVELMAAEPLVMSPIAFA